MKRDAVEVLVDADETHRFIDRIWQETDGTQSRRNDIVLNHMLQLHMLQGQYVENLPLPAVD